MSRKRKSAWENCSTNQYSCEDSMTLILNTIAKNQKIPKTQVIKMLLLESITYNMTRDAVYASGAFDELDNVYEEVKKKMKIMKDTA